MPSPLPRLCLGFALGGAITWLVLRSPSPSASDTPSPTAAAGPVVAPAWSWRDSATPPLFARDTAASAIAAWLTLRAPDGSAPTYANRAASLRALVLRLPADAFPRLLETLSRSEKDDDTRLRAIAFAAWTTQDAPTATRWALSQSEKTRALTREALDAWAAQDPAAASVWACAIPDDKLARELASRSLRVLAEKNPDRALALARSRDDAFRDAVLGSVIDALGKKDPAGTVRTFAPELWKNGAGFWNLRGPLNAWLKQDPSAALAWLVAQPSDSQGNNLSQWLGSLGDNTPAWRRTVADTISTAPGLANRASALNDLLFRWGNEQPDEALAWLKNIPDSDLRINLLERIAGSYYTNNPEKSLPLALAMPEGSKRSQNLSNLLGAWAKINPDAALAWLREHQSEPGVATASHTVHGALLAELARDDPQAAIAEWQAMSDPRARQTTLPSLIAAWGKKDPAAALQWSAAQPQPENGMHYGGHNDLVYQWARSDPEAALRWVEDSVARQPQHAGYITDQYLEALGGTWNEKAPRADTADLYLKIRDPKLRVGALTRHVTEWLTKDPAAARAWVATTPALTPAERTALLPAPR